MRDQPPGFRWSCLREVTNSVAAHYAREPERPNPGRIMRSPRIEMLALAGNNGEQESATFGLQPRRTKEAAPSLLADGADGNWLRGQDLNLRPSGYEDDFTQPADGRRSSVFQSYRGVGRTAESTAVHAGIHKSPRVWTRSGQSLGMNLALQRTATLCDMVTVEQLRAITQISSIPQTRASPRRGRGSGRGCGVSW